MYNDYSSFFSKAVALKSNIELLKQQHEEEKQKKVEAEQKLKNLIKEEHQYEKAVELMKSIIEGMSQSQIRHLEELINSALTTIFFDRTYYVELVVTELRNTNNLQIILSEVNDDGQFIKTKLEDNGYGVKSIIGFILQVYYILYHKQYPILFMDESFTNLSKQYLPYLKTLINDLAEKYNFIFVLVTHDTDIKLLSDRTYNVEKGVVKLVNIDE